METEYDRPNRRSDALAHSPSAYYGRRFPDDQAATGNQHRDPQFIDRLSRANFGKHDLDMHLHSSDTQPALYEMDHLVTFDVGTRGGVTSLADGVRKLRQMEATSGIWTRRVLMSIDQKELAVSEKTGGVELDCFPISQIRNPISHSDSNVPNVFNNLVMFVVDKETWTRQPAIMNIFQCVGSKSEDVVEDIKAACAGKFPRPKPRIDEGTQISKKTFDRKSQIHSEDESTGTGGNQLAGSSATNRVTLLNCCFDDIERFVAEIQKSAKTFKDKKETGDVMHPSKRDFVDALQKFKLALNLIVELRSFLYNPSASELVQSLFSPLTLVVSVCRDDSGHPKFVENILAPLLTADTCQFLENNLSQDHLLLWRSLGKTWTTSRETWSGPAPSNYVPKFRKLQSLSRSQDSNSPQPGNSQNGVSIVNEKESNQGRNKPKDTGTKYADDISI